jgi:hypothetical protein
MSARCVTIGALLLLLLPLGACGRSAPGGCERDEDCRGERVCDPFTLACVFPEEIGLPPRPTPSATATSSATPDPTTSPAPSATATPTPTASASPIEAGCVRACAKIIDECGADPSFRSDCVVRCRVESNAAEIECVMRESCERITSGVCR